MCVGATPRRESNLQDAGCSDDASYIQSIVVELQPYTTTSGKKGEEENVLG